MASRIQRVLAVGPIRGAVEQLDQPLLVLLFATRPAHAGLHEPGSEVVAALIKTFAPKVAIVAGEGASEERLGTSLVVCPGSVEVGDLTGAGEVVGT